MSLAKLYNKETKRMIYKETHEIRGLMADMDYILSSIEDSEKAVEDAKATYEQAKIKLIDIKNMLDSMMVE